MPSKAQRQAMREHVTRLRAFLESRRPGPGKPGIQTNVAAIHRDLLATMPAGELADVLAAPKYGTTWHALQKLTGERLGPVRKRAHGWYEIRPRP